MLLVSIGLFVLIEVGSGDISVKILGVFSTPEQRASYRAQLGLNAPTWQRYLDWLVGNDWRAKSRMTYPLITLKNPKTKEVEWWADVDGQATRWKMDKGELKRLVRKEDGFSKVMPAESDWIKGEGTEEFFWGVDNRNNAVKFVKGSGEEVWVLTKAGLRKQGDGPREYIPLRKGLIRGDAGLSWQYNRPVSMILKPRVRNTLVLAGVAFVVVMPLALFFGILAGINEGKLLDRIISITSLGATSTPEFVTGIFLILIFGIWLKVLPAVTMFTSSNAIFENPMMLALPVMTLTAVELGYVARMTRASMVEVMDSAYIRTAIVKGMPYWRVVFRHAIRNALMAPITIIMLHVNWLIGGVVVVEVIFGYPGLGKFIFDSAIFGDFSAIEAAAMVTVLIAIITRLIGDLAYTLLNPRVRYA
ncbi:MAG: ABC transporter permease [Deltaproteobacteria bacterium]|nr:ABC transporter permease [Deltaproteobacteria bacterium]MBW2611812.1 ABC transporter permease [Deltaproteobacteria bacterium]MBW2676646.1 ABC transporter permease [Deltaproteobacteria bacterium]